MIKDPQITLFDLTICLSDAADLISPALANHHKQVAYIAWCIAAEMGLDEERQKDLVLAASVHDIGSLSLNDRIETLEFETSNTTAHAEIGAALLRLFAPTAKIAEIVRRHHERHDESPDSIVTHDSQILHCADRVAVCISSKNNVLGQATAIQSRILAERGRMFSPDVCDAFAAVANKEYFWLDAMSQTVYRILRQNIRTKTLSLDIVQLRDLAGMFACIIDFRSRFTATHSAGVSSTAGMLAALAGFSAREQEYMKIAGLLHDLGKLAIPREILEKPGKLDNAEYDVIRSHTYHTYRILDTLEDFDTINTWGAFHHERLNGKGYPFHHTGDVLSLGSRIMCVSDIFTAITEDRPYRPGMTCLEATGILNSMTESRALDPEIVNLLIKNMESINRTRAVTQIESANKYETIFGSHHD